MMGIYSLLLFTSTFVFILLLCSVDPTYVHAWMFGIQMLWQTFWHLLIQYREYCLQEPVSIRLFLAVSSSMLLTQRLTSVSLDLQEKRVRLTSDPSSRNKAHVTILPLISYMLSFTTLLGGPLCSYSRFVSVMEGIDFSSPPCPLGVVILKLMQVLLLERVRCCLVYFLKDNPYNPVNSSALYGILWVWCLALVFRIQYYSHWRISEGLNNAAGFGFWDNLSGGSSRNWSGLSDGDIWNTEASSRMSEFARRWNMTTASWLRRLIYMRCQQFPLFMTFSFSLWWHGLHLGHFVGFLTWAATVKADYHIHRHMGTNLSPARRKVCKFLGWLNTQMIVSCVVIVVELRDMSGVRLLFSTYVGLFPFFNLFLFGIMLKLRGDTLY
ncbi:membrane-bound ghrelin O-acyltransferase mboat4 [Parambassis ranga]|uniref:Membrane-bound ghrelin O-acyltransferase mboat4 n=1 Tax=Parambassis ranga TaxID=210632 RepID=A0A6P7J0G2_9TELE|nr:ghrelin O-acyltransferase [Parambassis ranga]